MNILYRVGLQNISVYNITTDNSAKSKHMCMKTACAFTQIEHTACAPQTDGRAWRIKMLSYIKICWPVHLEMSLEVVGVCAGARTVAFWPLHASATNTHTQHTLMLTTITTTATIIIIPPAVRCPTAGDFSPQRASAVCLSLALLLLLALSVTLRRFSVQRRAAVPLFAQTADSVSHHANNTRKHTESPHCCHREPMAQQSRISRSSNTTRTNSDILSRNVQARARSLGALNLCAELNSRARVHAPATKACVCVP